MKTRPEDSFINALTANGRIEHGGRIVHVIDGTGKMGTGGKSLCGVTIAELTWGTPESIDTIGCLKCRKVAQRMVSQTPQLL